MIVEDKLIREKIIEELKENDKIIHYLKLDPQSKVIIMDVLSVLYEKVTGTVELLNNGTSETESNVPFILVSQICEQFFNGQRSLIKSLHRLPLDNGMIYVQGEEITVWIPRESIVVDLI